MEYKKIGETYYIRMDRDDEVIANILEVCHRESIPSAIFSSIGGCGNAELQVFSQLYHHTHALFSFKKDGQHGMAGGHLKATTVRYTAEIELRPTIGGAITRKFDPETGTGFWNFKN